MPELKFEDLDSLLLWEENPRQGAHDLGMLATSLRRHGMYKPILYDNKLNNGRGGVLAGNGITTALRQLKQLGEPAPQGVVVEGNRWLIPVVYGLEAETIAEASARGMDDNLTAFWGGGDLLTIYRGHNPEALIALATEYQTSLVGLGADEILGLQALLESDRQGHEAAFEDDTEAEEGDSRSPTGQVLDALARLNRTWPDHLSVDVVNGVLSLYDTKTGEILGEYPNIQVYD